MQEIYVPLWRASFGSVWRFFSLRRRGTSAEVTFVLIHFYSFAFVGQAEGEALLSNILSGCDLFRVYFYALATAKVARTATECVKLTFSPAFLMRRCVAWRFLQIPFSRGRFRGWLMPARGFLLLTKLR
jgi:hypothetical protein